MRCVVKITGDPAVVPLDSDALEALLQSDAVAGQAARDVSGMGSNVEFFHVRPVGDSDLSDSEPPTPAEARTVWLTLEVHLPAQVKAAAVQFGTALIDNLRRELEEAFDAHAKGLNNELNEAERERQAARAEFEEAIRPPASEEGEDIGLDPADALVYGQLEKIVSLPALHRDTTLQEAIAALSRSVEPPLKIVVLWKDLLDNARIVPGTLINMDMSKMSGVRLGMVLENVLRAVGSGFTELDYVVDRGVVTVATAERLRPKKMETRVHDVPLLVRAAGQTQHLPHTIQETIEPESWFELSDFGEGTIQSNDGAKLVVRQTHAIHKEIQKLLRRLAEGLAVTMWSDAPPETLDEQMKLLISRRDALEEDVDRLQKRQAELERERNEAQKRFVENSWDSIAMELYTVVSDLETVRAEIEETEPGAAVVADVNEVIEEVQSCLATHKGTPERRPPYVYISDIGPSWPTGTEEQVVVERVKAKQRELESITRRIADLQLVALGRTSFEPQVSRIQWAVRRLEQANKRVHDLRTAIANLRPPRVTVIGGSAQTLTQRAD